MKITVRLLLFVLFLSQLQPVWAVNFWGRKSPLYGNMDEERVDVEEVPNDLAQLDQEIKKAENAQDDKEKKIVFDEKFKTLLDLEKSVDDEKRQRDKLILVARVMGSVIVGVLAVQLILPRKA